MKQYRIKADGLIKYGIHAFGAAGGQCVIGDFPRSACENLYRFFFDEEAKNECLIRFFKAAFYDDIDLHDEVEMLCTDLASDKQIDASKYKLMHGVVRSIQNRERVYYILDELPLRDLMRMIRKFGDIVLGFANELEIVDYDGEL